MNVFGCETRCGCVLLSIFASLIVGIVTAFLQVTAVITVTPVFLWVAFGIGVGALAVSLIATSLAQRETTCGRSALTALLIGALGTVLLSLVLLGVGFAATSILGAVLLGVLLFFFALTLTSAACYTRAYVTQGE